MLEAHPFSRIGDRPGSSTTTGTTITNIGGMVVFHAGLTVFFRVDCVLGSDCTMSTVDLQITDGELAIFTPCTHASALDHA